MKSYIINPDNLKENELNEKVTRVKCFLISGDHFVLVSAMGGYQLPGGHVEENEDLQTAVLREINEETGIELDLEEITSPFYEIKRYKQNEQTNSKRLSKIIYYYIKTNKKPNKNKRNLTEHEKLNNFNLKLVHKDLFEQTILNLYNSEPETFNGIIAKEIIEAYNILKELSTI